MEYNDSQLEKVKELAGLLMNVNDISVMIGVNEDNFREDIGNKNTAISIAFRKGQIETALEMRKQEIEMAKLGSPMAIELIQKYIIDQKMSENG